MAKSKDCIAVFHDEFRQDLKYWVKQYKKTALRAFDLIEAILRSPCDGIGKPEPLKYLCAGAWSRRLTQEHRIIYLVRDARMSQRSTRASLPSSNSMIGCAVTLVGRLLERLSRRVFCPQTKEASCDKMAIAEGETPRFALFSLFALKMEC